MRHLALLVLSGGLLAACTVGPAYQRPAVTLPDAVRGADPLAPATAASLADRPWWEIVEDPALQALIDEALRNSFEIRQAAWRVEEARAAAGIARSERFPALDAAAGTSRQRQSSFVSPVTDTLDLHDVNLGLSWEIDLWGRIRRANEAALARTLATEEARRGVLLSLVADVVTGYFELRALDHQLEIARRTAAAFDETRTLFDRRLEAGLASGLETASAEASLAATLAAIPDLERRIAARENALALLVGRGPGEIQRGRELDRQLLPPAIPAGLPADLLERRPDLRQAEQELVAANAEVGVAVAGFYPTFSLTGAFGGVAPQLSSLLDEGKSWSIGGGLLTPVLQGRQLQSRHRVAVARWEQARIEFERRVTGALAEVATALVAYGKLADVEREQARAVASFQEAVELAEARYLSGLSDYLEVLQAQRQLFPAENALTQTRLARLATLAQLYRALGGGWQLDDPAWARERVAAAGTEPGASGNGPTR